MGSAPPQLGEKQDLLEQVWATKTKDNSLNPPNEELRISFL